MVEKAQRRRHRPTQASAPPHGAHGFQGTLRGRVACGLPSSAHPGEAKSLATRRFREGVEAKTAGELARLAGTSAFFNAPRISF